ncbi:NADH:flavin oxidoreductase [Clostridium sp. HMP27]|uniref:NADH:flavin oxidoreductase n=1 Tax=Clostridium sp. HMP27 TaxID=1487921 RepID=UPI00052BCECC|nr:NADH:flavin oxidoreductase [Clostridium sp. HMP27]KGK86758.1 oxidoreductase [Clostridium sp. HMP27]
MKNLFEYTTIKNMKLKNRFFKAAVWEELATEDGHMTEELFKVYEEIAKGGVGTIFTGYAYVEKNEQPNPRMMGIYDDSFIPEYKKLTNMAHSYQANIIMQIVYGGSMTHLVPPSPVIWGPSAIKNELTGIVPVEMSKEDIAYLIKSYGKAAARVKQAGFDGVELHAAHGYLLSQFLCPHYNTRTDEYGGSIENRARIILEIYDEIRKTVGDDFPVFIKINSEDFIEDGLTNEESIIVSKMLEEAGIGGIEVSGGNESAPGVLENNLGPARIKVVLSKDRESYFREHAMRLTQAVSIPIILTGGNRHMEVMDEILGSTSIAYFALGRPLISEPDLINIWVKGDYKVPKCVSCNQCYKLYGKRCVLNQKK